ncbi:class I SAM-dependent methyltransferase [Prosthecobacter sp.]|uniref:class I SAM-dependent methyltransferase n=1 Tax=Prosthecobacter sp. TaxID=1965333 RepID=UPI001D72348D|nr:class I SAM-dependent methyltransferase [Prosthecobacter sp.]MCB1277911.1 class I SAM-dependent methyltransferase [Prosthecobacter sp.]
MSDPNGYELLDSGSFQKLERFGSVVLSRPCAQAVWRQTRPKADWQKVTATFFRDGGNQWRGRDKLPETWTIEVDGTKFQLSSTDFGHLGIFPEQRDQWRRIRETCAAYANLHNRPARVLNLFAYSGGSTLAAAHAGAEVCHVDASKGMVDWARKNAALNGLEEKPVRWIVDDVTKFLERELRRERQYDLLILDPPSYGRGAKGEVFKIENDLPPLLSLLGKLMSSQPLGVLLSCHTPELTPISLHHLLLQQFGQKSGKLEHGEMQLRGAKDVLPVPSGSFCWWLA